MSAGRISTRSKGHLVKQAPSVSSLLSAKPAKGKIAKPSRLQMSQLQPKNGGTVFDAKTFLARAGLGRTIVPLKKGEVAYAQGDPADAIFYVQTGRLRVTVTSTYGKEATLTLVGAGDFLGENCMVSPHRLRLATATAMTECALLRIEKPEMVRVLHEEQDLSEVFISFILARNDRIQADMVDQLFNSSEKRLARILLLLAQVGKESKPETVVPKVSQEMLAQMIGTSRPRVSFFMNRFRKLGFI